MAVIAVAAVAGAGVGALVSGLGGGGGTVKISGSPKQAVDTVFAFERALAHHDWATICNKLYSDAARAGAGGDACPARLAAAAGSVANPRTRIISVDVRGDQATVRLSAIVAGGSAVTNDIHMVREHGGYRILYSGAGELGD